MPRKKRRKTSNARCIRTYQRIANQNHGECPFCRHDIEAGDEYEGSVYVNGARLWVVKEHTYCLPWDVDEYRNYDHDEISASEDLAEAA